MANENDISIPINAEDKATPVFRFIDQKITEHVTNIEKTVQKSTASIDSGFDRIISGAKNVAIGFAAFEGLKAGVAGIKALAGGFQHLVESSAGLNLDGKRVPTQLEQLEARFSKTAQRIGQSIGGALDESIGRLSKQYAPEIDNLIGGMNRLGNAAVKILIPGLELLAKNSSDFFVTSLNKYGLNANSFADGVSKSFDLMGRNVAKVLALGETAAENWSRTWKIATTSSAIALVDWQQNFRTVMQGVTDKIRPFFKGEQYYAERGFDFLLGNGGKWRLNPKKIGNYPEPGTTAAWPEGDATRRALQNDLGKLMQSAGGDYDRHLRDNLRDFSLIKSAWSGLGTAPPPLAGGGAWGPGLGPAAWSRMHPSNLPAGTGSNLVESRLLTRGAGLIESPELRLQRMAVERQSEHIKLTRDVLAALHEQNALLRRRGPVLAAANL